MASACRWWQHCVAAALDSTTQQSSFCITQECPTLLQPCLTLQRRQPAQLLQLSTHAAPAEKLQPAAPCRLEATSALLQFVDIRIKAPCCQAPDRRLGCKQLGCQAPQIGLQRGSKHWLQTKGPCRCSCRTPTSPSTGLTEELPSDPCPERCTQAQLHNFAEVLGTQSCSSMSMYVADAHLLTNTCSYLIQAGGSGQGVHLHRLHQPQQPPQLWQASGPAHSPARS